jgi:fermentation-respiration switch protein FrsA (DUF1100 family)
MSSDTIINTIVDYSILVGKTTIGFSILICLVLYKYQDNLLYHPCPPGLPKRVDENPEGVRHPGEWSIKGHMLNFPSSSESIPYEDVMLETKDGVMIHTWLLLQKNSSNVPTLIYFHGNAGNMGYRLQNAAEMYARVGINILMMDYRGYGNSTGTPTEKGLILDAEKVVQYASSHPKLTNSSIIVFGRSLGGAVSVAIAEQYPDLVKGLILENTFLSISKMVDRLLPFVSLLKPLVLRINWNSENTIKNLKQPIMFIAGERDELVPHSHMQLLMGLATASVFKDWFPVKTGTHNDTWVRAGSNYYKRMSDFINKAFGGVCKNDDNSELIREKVADVLPTMQTDFTIKRKI